jgi:hypothetical protein
VYTLLLKKIKGGWFKHTKNVLSELKKSSSLAFDFYVILRHEQATHTLIKNLDLWTEIAALVSISFRHFFL